MLDPPVLYAEREAGLPVKSALRTISDQFRERRFNLLDLVQLRRRLHSCLNHGVTIATVQINTICNFWPPLVKGKPSCAAYALRSLRQPTAPRKTKPNKRIEPGSGTACATALPIELRPKLARQML